MVKVKNMKDYLRGVQVDACLASAILSFVTILLFHFPLLRYTFANIPAGVTGFALALSIILLLFCLNFLFGFLLLQYCGKAGKVIISIFLTGNAIGLYGINKFKALITDQMMVNVFNTRMSEAGAFFSFSLILYILFLAVLPSAILFAVKIRKSRRIFSIASIAAPIVAILAIVGLNYRNMLWIDRHSTVMGSLVLPWSYIVNSGRAAGKYYDDYQWKNNAEKLPDITCTDSTKTAVVLVIGESARRENFQLYGYGRATNPLLSADMDSTSLKAYNAVAAGVSTIDGVKAILSYKDRGRDRVEILPNYLFRSGVDVLWQTSNWGEKPLLIDNIRSAEDIAKETGKNPACDEILLDGIDKFITSSTKPKVFVVLHTSTSHGPLYNEKYPPEFEVFTPICNTVAVSDCPREHLVNSYDNSIVYTDYILHSLIHTLSSIEGWKISMIYVSDHGESLGEEWGSFGKMYMHGSIPYDMAPPQQTEIPFIVWSNVPGQQYKDIPLVQQYSAFHSTMGFLGLQSAVYDESMDIFSSNSTAE